MHVPAAGFASSRILMQHAARQYQINSALQQRNNKAACMSTVKVALGIHLLYAAVADESKSLTDRGSRAALYDASGLAGAAVGKERSGSVTCC